jgi:DNA-binding response OmpR family regulator
MSKNIKTLIVEDDPTWQMVLESRAKKAGIKEPDIVLDDKDAFSFLEKNNYQLMILDTYYGNSYLMGPKIAKKAFEMGQSPKIIALSSEKDNEKLWHNKTFKYTFFNKADFGVSVLKTILDDIAK